MSAPIRVEYFLRIPNVGDRITPDLVSAVSGRPVVRTRGKTAPHVVAVGSMMAGTTPTSVVWGTGVIDPAVGVGGVAAPNVHAVRGPLTHRALRDAGVDVGDVPYGDPGHLAPEVYGVTAAASPSYDVGVVAHYTDRAHPAVASLLGTPGVRDLDVFDDPAAFLRTMAECRVVLSSSLHGLIFAEALGLPSLWVTAGEEVVGGGFKFRDWFATTTSPQEAPVPLTEGVRADTLARRAELRGSTVDHAALREAFPTDRLAELEEPGATAWVPVEECRRRPVPVFLISFNRGGHLRRAMRSIARLTTPTEVVVHDNGSTDPATLAVLEELEREGVAVYRYPPISSPDELDRVDESVARYFSDWAEPGRYVVSDCDIDLSEADPRALAVYDELLNRFRSAQCVGPMLRIRDIPTSYPLYNRVMNRHIRQFWQHRPDVVRTSVGEVAVLESKIDTTFALHRAGEPFRRLKRGLRVYEPYEAIHLDWYEPPDPAYWTSSSPEVSHWSNPATYQQFGRQRQVFSEYFAVRQVGPGRLETYVERVAPAAGAAERGSGDPPAG